jgi:hypothetical protein
VADKIIPQLHAGVASRRVATPAQSTCSEKQATVAGKGCSG